MENTRHRGRKRYCCCYCNVYFHQIDSWQRHNRKHTGVEIECDDCGEMCSDNFELKSHQQLCEAYRIYSEELFTDGPGGDAKSSRKNNGKEQVHDTPDSTSSKQEILHENEELSRKQHTNGTGKNRPWRISDSRSNEEETSLVASTNEDSNNKNTSSELDEFIGEDRETMEAAADDDEEETTLEENEDPETEALIGVDESVSRIKADSSPTNDDKPGDDNSIGVDSQIVIKVESALNDAQRGIQQKIEEKGGGRPTAEAMSFLARPSPSGSSMAETVQAMTLENSELNKKYQPYFCKNCGARFTRKDSVTRHLKKGTCSGKSAIVCNICGKVFPEMYELQQHFKLDHKNVLIAPTIVTHRTILPKPADHPDQTRVPQHYNTYPAPFVLRDQHLPPTGSRPFSSSDQQPYRSMPPGIQNVFYPPGSGGQNSYNRHRNNFPPSNQGGHYRGEQNYPSSRPYDMKYSPGGMSRKEPTSNDKSLVDKMNRKRDHRDFHTREKFSDRGEDTFMGKRNKVEYEYNEKVSSFQKRDKQHGGDSKNQINLSEYTNNAMNSQQYFSKRFVQKENSAIVGGGGERGGGENEASNQIHQCKICGNEFPRFEYLLTHLRKHKEKPEDQEGDEQKESVEAENRNDVPNAGQEQNQNNDTDNINDSNSSDDSNDKRPVNYRISPSGDRPKTLYLSNHEPVTVVMQQPPPQGRYSSGSSGGENILQPHVDQMQVYPHQPPPPQHIQAGVVNESTLEAITPGVDGKFRPFICENCGQRFTRKDSLVRHAKKQTCYEEQTDLKCKHCDKTFRYHKCLVQHQELVHGISREEQGKNNPPRHSDDDDTDSDRSEKNENYQDEKRNISFEMKNNKKYRVGTSILDLSPKPSSKHNYHPQHATLPAPNHQQRMGKNFASPAFVQMEQQNQTPKFIPPRSDEKMKSNHHPGDVTSQDTQYIGYCTVPRPFQCEYCGDRFAHRHSLKRHVRRHLGIGIPCHECGKLYRDQSEWRRHQRSIHNRHYEKYEVPSRISFRDGVENGLIGVVPNSEYNFDTNDGSDSDKSDDDITMVKSSKSTYSHLNSINNNNNNNTDPERKMETDESHGVTDVTNQSDPTDSVASLEDEQSKADDADNNKQQPKQPFNFKLYSSGDKDSRKSALDRYLRSSNSDEEEEARASDGVEREGDDEEETVRVEDEGERDGDDEAVFETNNNNNNNNTTPEDEEKKMKASNHDKNTTEMVTVHATHL